VLEGRFEDGADVAIGHQLARTSDGLAVLPGLLVHQRAVGEQLPRAPADLGALLEDGREARRGERPELGGVAAEPQAARALESGQVLRLAECGLHVSGGSRR
jgi:hypothetical protein